MAGKEESSKSGSEEQGKEQLEGATGSGVVMKAKKKKTRKSRKSGKSRKSDVPACETLEKCSVSSAKTEISQSEWLNDVGAPGSKKPSSSWESFVGFLSDYKYSIAATVALAGVLVYFSVKKTATRCPFTGKKSA